MTLTGQTQHWRELCRTGIAASGIAALSSFSSYAFSAEDGTSETAKPADITKLDTVVVTGSHLRRVDIEGMLPTAVITQEQIAQSGRVSVAEVLRDHTFNSFGSFTPLSGTGAQQGGAKVNLGGLGAERALILIDGRRIPNNPAFGAAAQNINNIPMALVKRIEILRGSASAIYGSDAIGGVVNIITRDDYNGAQFKAQIDRPSIIGGDANMAALTGGISKEKNKLYFSLELYNKDIINGRDLDAIRNLSVAPGYPGTIYQYDANGNVVPQTSNPDATGKPHNFRPFDDCPTTGFGTDPQFPYSNVVDGRCRYRSGEIVGLTAAVKRQSLTLGASHAFSPVLSSFARLMMTRSSSFGRFASAPVSSVVSGINAPDANGNIGIRLAPDNPNNPNPGSTLVLNYIPTVLGFRDYRTKDQVNQFLLGIKGNLGAFGFKSWEVAGSYDAYLQNGKGINNGLMNELQAAVDAGRFNPFAPDASVAREFRYTTRTDNRFVSKGIDSKLNYELDLAGTNIPFVFGMEYRQDNLAVVSDAQSSQAVFFAPDGSVSGFQQSNVFGAVGGSVHGARAYKAAYLETAAKLNDNALELGYALRFDHYNDVGNAINQKFSVAYRPADSVLLRGSFGEGFRAPDFSSMYGAPSKSTILIIDRLSCQNHPEDSEACATSPRTAIYDSNPALKAETSKNLLVGFVWSIGHQFSTTLDYYSIKVRNAITRLAPQTVFDNELRCAGEGRKCNARQEGYVVRTQTNSLLFAYAPAINAARLETKGIDWGTSYRLRAGRYGSYTASTHLARTLSYKRQDAPGVPLLERLDSLNASGEIFPKFRANATLHGSLAAYDSTLRANYISNISDCDAQNKLVGNPACRNKFGDYLTFDLQLGVNTVWNQHMAIGARNLFNTAPSVSRYVKSASIPGTFYPLHDSDQRVLYLSFTQDF